MFYLQAVTRTSWDVSTLRHMINIALSCGACFFVAFGALLHSRIVKGQFKGKVSTTTTISNPSVKVGEVPHKSNNLFTLKKLGWWVIGWDWLSLGAGVCKEHQTVLIFSMCIV